MKKMHKITAMALLLAAVGCAQKNENGPASSAPSGAAALSSWVVSEAVDPITDTKTITVSQPAKQHGDFQIQIECSDGKPSISLWGERFFPTVRGEGETYSVSYRFDSKPGVQFANWRALKHWASPPDEAAFLKEMLGAKTLYARVDSEAMEVSEGQFYLAGLPEALAKSRKLCPSLSA